MRWCVVLAWLAVAAAPARAGELPIFDAHLHYNAEAVARYPVPQVLELFQAAGVRGILANSRPNDGTHALLAAQGPALWVVPFLRPYRVREDIGTWFKDPSVLAFLESELERGLYAGIGEFHLHGQDAAGAQVKQIVRLVAARGLWLHAHSDSEAIELLYAHDPRARVIWAHTGFGVPPETVERLLDKHPSLMGELSYRGGLTEGGALTLAWRQLFSRRPDRFLVGSDTWMNERWDGYPGLIADYRAWLAQLPPEAAAQIAHKNAERIFRPQ